MKNLDDTITWMTIPPFFEVGLTVLETTLYIIFNFLNPTKNELVYIFEEEKPG